jgi:hypothetical protein
MAAPDAADLLVKADRSLAAAEALLLCGLGLSRITSYAVPSSSAGRAYLKGPPRFAA